MEINIKINLADEQINEALTTAITKALAAVDVSTEVDDAVSNRVKYLFEDGEFDDKIAEAITEKIENSFLEKWNI